MGSTARFQMGINEPQETKRSGKEEAVPAKTRTNAK